MNKRILTSAFALTLVFASDAAIAAQVRGRVDFYGPSGIFPMVNAQVALCWAQNACAYYVTGQDGMYYLMMDPGNYYLYINGMPKQQVFIPPNLPLYDVPPYPGNQ